MWVLLTLTSTAYSTNPSENVNILSMNFHFLCVWMFPNDENLYSSFALS